MPKAQTLLVADPSTEKNSTIFKQRLRSHNVTQHHYDFCVQRNMWMNRNASVVQGV
jgi:hypothetical protein